MITAKEKLEIVIGAAEPQKQSRQGGIKIQRSDFR